MNALEIDQKPKDLECTQEEWLRLQILLQYEEEARLKGWTFIAGIDEAGRGPLAGPVVAAACMIPKGKKLTAKQRQQLFERLTSDSRVQFGIGIVHAAKIDEINIYQATIRAMLMAVDQLLPVPHCLLVDGLGLPHPSIPSTKIIQGDGKSQSIAAASVIAKVTRDQLMCHYHEQWPQYGFVQHKGYGTAQHLEAIEKHGPCPIHRLSFEPLKTKAQQLSLIG
jgi:ribonuclease HII